RRARREPRERADVARGEDLVVAHVDRADARRGVSSAPGREERAQREQHRGQKRGQKPRARAHQNVALISTRAVCSQRPPSGRVPCEKIEACSAERTCQEKLKSSSSRL